jgi:hypothetical protein
MKTSILIIPTLLLVACGGSSTDVVTNQPKVKEVETPKALKETSSGGGSFEYSRGDGGSLVDKLYSELVDKNPELKKIEDGLSELSTKVADKKAEFEAYNYKSEDYYSDADVDLNMITDSTIKKQIREVLDKSQKAYKAKTAGVKGLISLLDKGNATLTDHHTVLKIVATLPQIEQYQKDKLPANKTYYGLVQEQEKLDKIIIQNTPAE